MPVGYGTTVLMRERIEHRVVWVDGGQAVSLQLLSNNGHQLLHTGIIVSPVTHNLEAMGQVAVCIREVRLELEGSPVTLKIVNIED